MEASDSFVFVQALPVAEQPSQTLEHLAGMDWVLVVWTCIVYPFIIVEHIQLIFLFKGAHVDVARYACSLLSHSDTNSDITFRQGQLDRRQEIALCKCAFGLEWSLLNAWNLSHVYEESQCSVTWIVSTSQCTVISHLTFLIVYFVPIYFSLRFDGYAWVYIMG